MVGLLLLTGLFSLIPPARCKDGWHSPSIGQQGACSHHGGVKRHKELAFLAIAISFGAGLFTTVKLSAIAERHRKAKFKRSLVPPAPDASTETVILYAILSESKIEFMYKGRKDFVPALCVVSPTALNTTGGKYGKAGIPCVVGHCHACNAQRTFDLGRISGLKLHQLDNSLKQSVPRGLA